MVNRTSVLFVLVLPLFLLMTANVAHAQAICNSVSGTPIDTIPITTAAVIATSGQSITTAIDASGCNVGVYVGPGVTGVTITATVSNAVLAGIYVDGGNANVVGSNVFQIGDTPFDGVQYGLGILYVGGATGEVINTQVSSYQKGGIVIKGAGTSVTVSGDTVTGLGPVPYIAQNGVEFASGATGSVTDSTIQGNSYTGLGSGRDYITETQSCGILLFGSNNNVQVLNNNVLDNDIGACIVGTSGIVSPAVTVSNNQFTSNTEQYYGIIFDTVNGISSNNLISNSLVGVMAITSSSANTIVTSRNDQFSGITENYQSLSIDSPYFATIGPIINVTMIVKNDEDTSWSSSLDNYYWALDNYTKDITVWQIGPSKFEAFVTYNGRWQTFKGALSPGNGVSEPANGNGIEIASYNAIFGGTPLAMPTEPTTGNLLNDSGGKVFNFGGTQSDLLIGTVAKGQQGDSNAINWVSFYFEDANTIYDGFYSAPSKFTYTYTGSPLGTQTFVNSFTNPSSGDIITGPLLNTTMRVTNDEDSGKVGYWALDNYIKDITVWQTSSNAFVANVIYLGTWCTFAGALSPQNGMVEPHSGCGSMQGGYTGTFTATTFNAPAPTSNSMGSFDFGGTQNDILLGSYSKGQTGPTTLTRWLGYYFPGNTDFAYTDGGNAWSWTYTSTNSTYLTGNTWINGGAGSSGEIITGPSIHVTYRVRGDSDSGYNGYWALDNYTQTLTVWHAAEHQYKVNVTDVGTSCIFAGAPSPNAGISQIANGCVSMLGGYDGYLTTSVTPVNTSATTIGTGTLDFGGTEIGILSQHITDASDAYASWIDYFFPAQLPRMHIPTHPSLTLSIPAMAGAGDTQGAMEILGSIQERCHKSAAVT